MKIYSISDTHLGNKNKRINEKFELMLEDIIKEFGKNENNLLLIAGDVFQSPNVKNRTLEYLIELPKKFDNLKIMMISGNHDVSPIYKPSSIEILESLLSIDEEINDIKTFNVFEDFYSLPSIIVSSNNLKRIVLKDCEVLIDLLPYGSDHKECSFKKKEKEELELLGVNKRILVCHGDVEGYDIFSEDKLEIKESLVSKYDLTIKGHIHKTYKIDQLNLYSPGAINSTNSSSQGSYLDINSDLEVNINSLPLENLIQYKIFMNESKETINSTLESLGQNDIVSIYFNGDSDDIDQELYFKCFHNCLKFNLVFEDKSILKAEDISSVNLKGNLFKDFYKYMEEYMGNTNLDSSKLKKAYSNIMKNIEIKEV